MNITIANRKYKNLCVRCGISKKSDDLTYCYDCLYKLFKKRNQYPLTLIQEEIKKKIKYRMIDNNYLREEYMDRICSKIIVNKTNHCWEWHGSLCRQYGCLYCFSKQYRAHRFFYMLYVNNFIPDDKYILHKCDNPKCCNPQHLFLGTQHDNISDMYNKHRQPDVKGINNGRSILTEKDALDIRQSVYKYSELAKQYHVSKSTIQRIKSYETWRHI